MGDISAGFGDHPHVRDRPGEADLPRALSRLAGQVAERDTLEARDVTQAGWLGDLQRQLVQLSDPAEAREQRQQPSPAGHEPSPPVTGVANRGRVIPREPLTRSERPSTVT